MITITADFDFNELNSIIEQDVDDWFDELGRALLATGKRTIDRQIAKIKTGPFTGGGFGNITYNLKSSMGVGLVINKQIKEAYFPFGKGGDGKTKGRQLLSEVAAETKEDICLIVVAGEKYGVFVQQKGYDVITMAEGTLGEDFLKSLNNG